jgi:type I restriction enzyme S subunit
MAGKHQALRTIKLRECAVFQEGYVNPSQTVAEYFGDEIKWLRAVDLNDSFVWETSRRLSRLGYESAGKASLLFKPDTLAISKSGTIGRLGILKDYMCGNRAVINISVDLSCYDCRFIFYSLLWRRAAIEELASGSVQRNLYCSVLGELEIEVPPIHEQKAIAGILGALDDKIELNRQMNVTLEGMARALFQSWFVDFDPVRAKLDGLQPPGLDQATAALFPDRFQESELGQIPRGWDIFSLAELTSFLGRGISPAYVDEGGVVVLNQKCVRNHRVDFSVARRHDPTRKPIGGRKLIPFDILVNSTGVGTLGRVAHLPSLPNETTFDSHITAIRAAAHVDSSFLGVEIVRREPEIEALGEGTTGQTELSRVRLGALRVATPPLDLQHAFGRSVRPVFARIAANDRESRTLAALRDTLLPKLLSGDLRVADAVKEAENVV